MGEIALVENEEWPDAYYILGIYVTRKGGVGYRICPLSECRELIAAIFDGSSVIAKFELKRAEEATIELAGLRVKARQGEYVFSNVNVFGADAWRADYLRGLCCYRFFGDESVSCYCDHSSHDPIVLTSCRSTAKDFLRKILSNLKVEIVGTIGVRELYAPGGIKPVLHTKPMGSDSSNRPS